MDCPLCKFFSSSMIARSLNYAICGSCSEGARNLVAFMNEDGTANGSAANRNSLKGYANALKWVKNMKVEEEEELKDKVSYLCGCVAVFRDQIHTDIQVKPGSGPSISAHKALLAARSAVFKNMLDFDGCMAPPQEVVNLRELNYEELQAFLEFLYSGSLPKEKMDKHVYALSIAADKYEVPFLQKFCEKHMLRTMNSSNALEVLEISDTCSSKILKEATIKFIVQNMEDIVFSSTFDDFARKNPHLCTQIMRASCLESET